MGAGHCPLGGNTDRSVCNTHGEVHLACVPKMEFLGPTVLMLQMLTNERKARKYI